MPNPRNLNKVLGFIGTAIRKLAAKWGEDILRVEYVQVFPSTLERKGERDAKIRVSRPDTLYAKPFTRRDLLRAVVVCEINDVAIAV